MRLKRKSRNLLFVGLGIYLLLIFPVIRHWMESIMVVHMLVQIPSLVLVGYLIGVSFRQFVPKKLEAFNQGGIPGILIVLFGIAHWILPRSLDAALNESLVELLKFITLPILVGIPLSLSWWKLHSITKSFLWANLISMIFVMGWLYLVSPLRVCNNYLVEQQIILGRVLIVVGILLLIVLVGRAFVQQPTNTLNA